MIRLLSRPTVKLGVLFKLYSVIKLLLFTSFRLVVYAVVF